MIYVYAVLVFFFFYLSYLQLLNPFWNSDTSGLNSIALSHF